MSYQALIGRISTRPHPNADRLQLGTISGYQVICGLDVKDGDIGVFFGPDGQLSPQMATENNLYRAGKGENRDPNKSGFLESNRRIKSIKLRGAISDGLFLSLDSLAWAGDTSHLKPGDVLTHIGKNLICEKYYSPATQRAMAVAASKNRKYITDPDMFYKHFDTAKLRNAVTLIPRGAHLILTAKLHGTSGRTGNVLVTKQYPKPIEWLLKAIQALIKVLTGQEPDLFSTWKHVTGTRNVVLNASDWKPTDEYRKVVHQMFNLHKGETVYYEIVGYDHNGKLIMPPQPISKKDEATAIAYKRYGSHMKYTYGCLPSEHRVYIYRITQTNIDGEVVDLSWSQVVARAKTLGIPTVPVIEELFHTGSEALMDLCRDMAETRSVLDPSHIEEGVCIRVEHPDLNTIYKYKSFLFCALEGIAKNSDEYIDPEEIS